MIATYMKIAWRKLMKDKVFSFINIFGLSVGLTCCMLISLYVYSELNYDTSFNNADRIYQLGTDFDPGTKEDRAANTAGPIGRMLQQDYPEIQSTARLLRLFTDDKTLMQVTGEAGELKSFYETNGYLADSSFFTILNYDFKEGNAKISLVEPNTVVIDESIAKKLFGKTPALNKTIRISSSTNGDNDFKVTGVFRQPTTPSHIDARFIMSIKGGRMEGFANNNPSMVNNNMFYTYLLLKEGADAKQLSQKFPAFINTHLATELKNMGKKRAYFITNLKDIHLRSGFTENVTPAGSLTSLYILASIAFLTLLIACINFMNLSTANSSKRASEVGVRKVLGAEKRALLWQFLGESVLMAMIAMLFAFILTPFLKPLFEQVTGSALPIGLKEHFLLYLGFISLAITTGLFAGIYPAFYLSAFKPIKVLKGKFTNSLAAVSLRKGMVVFQFVISIALIVASVVIASQMKYLRSKDLGFAKDQQIVLPLRSENAKKLYASLTTEIAGYPGISSVGASLYYPGIFNPSDWLLYKEGTTVNEAKTVYVNFVDPNFLQTLDIRKVAGRLFSKAFPSDTINSMILNEEGVKKFQFKSADDAIGKWVAFDWNGEQQRFNIVGIVKDFHFKDLHSAVEPFGFLLNSGTSYNYLIAHSKDADIGKSIAFLKTTWEKMNPNEPFEYSFLDQDFQKNYEADKRQAALINYFTVIAIIISCLGLFGLATFSAAQRTKEIGIRKVLGASVASVVTLLSRDFIKLIILAVFIASPIAWFVMNKWLQGFNYRIDISWQVFAITTILAIAIGLLTISFQSIKTAISNPVKSLRSE
jgi:putative ABC transport system permease protein